MAIDSSKRSKCSSQTAKLWYAIVRTSSLSVGAFSAVNSSSWRRDTENSTFSRASLCLPNCESTAQRFKQVSASVSSFLLFHYRCNASWRHCKAVLSLPVLRQQQALLLRVMARYFGCPQASASAFCRKTRVRSNLSFCRKIIATRLQSSHILIEMRSCSSLSAPKQLRLNSSSSWYLSSASLYFASRCSCSPWLSRTSIRSRMVGSIYNITIQSSSTTIMQLPSQGQAYHDHSGCSFWNCDTIAQRASICSSCSLMVWMDLRFQPFRRLMFFQHSRIMSSFFACSRRMFTFQRFICSIRIFCQSISFYKFCKLTRRYLICLFSCWSLLNYSAFDRLAISIRWSFRLFYSLLFWSSAQIDVFSSIRVLIQGISASIFWQRAQSSAFKSYICFYNLCLSFCKPDILAYSLMMLFSSLQRSTFRSTLYLANQAESFFSLATCS